jgi:hypothetical protein
MFQRSLIWVIPLVPMLATVVALYNTAGLTSPALLYLKEARDML